MFELPVDPSILSSILLPLCAVAILGLAVLAARDFSRESSAALIALSREADKKTAKIIDVLTKELSPKIQLHDSAESVARRAAQVISDAATQPAVIDRRITFYGAASLSTGGEATGDATDGAQLGGSSQVEQKSPAEVYREALQAATAARTAMNRYINLFTEEEIEHRSQPVQSEYVAWLDRQYSQLSEDELYKLAHVVRAPQWGTNMARIITKTTIMEITGNGSAAVSITSEDFAREIRKYARTAVLGKNPRNPIKYYSIDSGLAEFKAYIGRIKRAVGQPAVAATGGLNSGHDED